MTKKATTRRKMPSAPIVGKQVYVKGIGKKGIYEGGQVPFNINPKYGPNGPALNGAILGRQGS
jgi:hypothetical protein